MLINALFMLALISLCMKYFIYLLSVKSKS